MAMKSSWFQHTECTTAQAEELMATYRARGVKVERSLNPGVKNARRGPSAKRSGGDHG